MSSLSDRFDLIATNFADTPVAEVTKHCSAECKKRVRKAIVEGMRLANRRPGGIDYGESLDPAYWNHTGPLQWKVKPGVKPSAAIARIFDLNAGSNMECLSVMSAIYYRAILAICGPEKFDKMFAGGHRPEISQGSPIFSDYTQNEGSSAPIQAGDWVYVRGHPGYDSGQMNSVLGAGSGAWRGENAVSNGDGTYSGLGLDRETQKQMTKDLLGGYNEKVDEYNHARPHDTPAMPHGTLEQMPGIDPASKFRPNFDAICKCGGS